MSSSGERRRVWGRPHWQPPWIQRTEDGVQPQPQGPPHRQEHELSQRHPHPQRWASFAEQPPLQVSAGLLGVLQVMGFSLGWDGWGRIRSEPPLNPASTLQLGGELRCFWCGFPPASQALPRFARGQARRRWGLSAGTRERLGPTGAARRTPQRVIGEDRSLFSPSPALHEPSPPPQARGARR